MPVQDSGAAIGWSWTVLLFHYMSPFVRGPSRYLSPRAKGERELYMPSNLTRGDFLNVIAIATGASPDGADRFW